MNLIFENACKYKNNIYFFAREYNAIYKFSEKDNVAQYVMSLSEYPFFSKRLFGPVCVVGTFLIFAPLSANEILVVDVETKKYKLVSMPINEEDREAKSKFHEIVSVNDNVYLFGGNCRQIIKYNPYTGIVDNYTDWFIESKIRYNENDNAVFFQDARRDENKIIIPCCYNNKIVEFDIETEEVSVVEVPDFENGFSGMCYDGNDYWLVAMRDNYIINWNRKEGCFLKIELPNTNGVNGVKYVGVFYYDGHVIVQQACTGLFFEIDTNSKEIKKYIFVEKEFSASKEYRLFFIVKGCGNIILCNSENGNTYSIMSFENNKRMDVIEDDKAEVERLKMVRNESITFIEEGKELSIDNYIDYIINN